MELLLLPGLLVMLVLFVAWPLFREDAEPWERGESDPLSAMTAQKEEALDNLKDIEMDYRMGKLSFEDYERLRGEWEAKAIAALRQLDRMKVGGAKSRRRG